MWCDSILSSSRASSDTSQRARYSLSNRGPSPWNRPPKWPRDSARRDSTTSPEVSLSSRCSGDQYSGSSSCSSSTVSRQPRTYRPPGVTGRKGGLSTTSRCSSGPHGHNVGAHRRLLVDLTPVPKLDTRKVGAVRIHRSPVDDDPSSASARRHATRPTRGKAGLEEVEQRQYAWRRLSRKPDGRWSESTHRRHARSIGPAAKTTRRATSPARSGSGSS